MINYNGKVFRSIANSTGGTVDNRTTFNYHQLGQYIWATYQGGLIKSGTIKGKVTTQGKLMFSYTHIRTDGQQESGVCQSKPELLADGRVRLHETWQWTSGANGTGESTIEEIVKGE